jgi:hypothetical protein
VITERVHRRRASDTNSLGIHDVLLRTAVYPPRVLHLRRIRNRNLLAGIYLGLLTGVLLSGSRSGQLRLGHRPGDGGTRRPPDFLINKAPCRDHWDFYNPFGFGAALHTSSPATALNQRVRRAREDCTLKPKVGSCKPAPA